MKMKTEVDECVSIYRFPEDLIYEALEDHGHVHKVKGHDHVFIMAWQWDKCDPPFITQPDVDKIAGTVQV